jgi:hypothetical protein
MSHVSANNSKGLPTGHKRQDLRDLSSWPIQAESSLRPVNNPFFGVIHHFLITSFGSLQSHESHVTSVTLGLLVCNFPSFPKVFFLFVSFLRVPKYFEPI